MSKSPEAWREWFEAIWKDREERIYRSFFEDLGAGIFTLSADVFSRLGVAQPDPGWLHHGVFECRPTSRRTSWLYVTSALSSHWGEEPASAARSDFSGLGMELVLEAPEQAPWAIGALHWLMAVQILVAAGQLRGELLHYYDRVPLRTSVDPARPDSPIRNLLVAEPQGYPAQFRLASGKVGLMLCVGITDAEHAFAKDHGGDALASLLKQRRVFPVTDPGRSSIVA
jgi:hypothetical protein